MSTVPDTGTEIESRLGLARLIAVEAGLITLRYFGGNDFEVEEKEDGSPLTIADREAEMFLRDRIAESFPHDAIVGEEFGITPGTSGFEWVLDPIDGTKSFVSGVPLYGTMVGVRLEGDAIIGSISFPPLGESIHAAKGGGAWYVRKGKPPVRIQALRRNRRQSVLLTTCEHSLAGRIGLERWQELGKMFTVCRTWGDVYGYLLVATGRADAMIDAAMSVWDAAALLPVIVEAGGKFSDWKGIARVDGGDSIAATGGWYEKVLPILKSSL